MPVISTIAAATARAFGAFKSAAGGAADEFFNYVTLLLHGDGTNGAQNNTFLDSSTNNFTITRNGNTTQGTFSPFSQTGWSNYFDGSGDYLTVADNAAFPSGTSEFCYEAWVYLTSSTAGNLFGKGGSTIYEQISIYFTGSAWRVYIADTSNNYIVNAITFGSPAINTWNHVAVYRIGNTFYGASNGTVTSLATSSSSVLDNNGPFVIGGVSNSSGPLNTPITGYVSNARVVNGSAVYGSTTFTPPTAPLTAISGTSLLTCQSNRFVDNSSNAFAITVVGNTSVQAFSPFAPTAAYSAATVGGSGYFDGSGDNLTAVSANTANAMGTGDWTVEAWIYLTTGGGTPFIMDTLPASSGSTTGLRMRLNASNQLQLWQYSSAVLTSSASVAVNGWTHVALVKNSGTTTAYVNGVASGTYSDSGNYTCGSSRPMIGSDGFNNGSENSFPGYISNLRMVKGTAVYTSAFTPPTAPLTAISGTSLLTNFTNGGIIDNTAKNVLETVGNAQISTSVKKFGTGSLAFDGTGDYLVVPVTESMKVGSGDFTIECWLRWNSTLTPSVWWASSSSSILISDSAATYAVISSSTDTAGGYSKLIDANTTLAANTWGHVAIVRYSGTTTIYLNGVSGGTTTSISGSFDCAYIGYQKNAGRALNGYIDDLRITKGIARYTANFTPQTSQWQDQ